MHPVDGSMVQNGRYPGGIRVRLASGWKGLKVPATPRNFPREKTAEISVRGADTF